MIVAITGPRDMLAGTEDLVRKWISAIPMSTLEDYEVICGGASGVDTVVFDAFKAVGTNVRIIRPDYRRYPGALAPLVRNADIVSQADRVHGFWHGKAMGGTLNTLWLGQKLLKIKPTWTIIDPTINEMEADAAFVQICKNPPTHWIQALNLWRQSIKQPKE